MVGQVIWITGLSGSGKTTIAEAICPRFKELGLSPIILDGDILREIFTGTNKNKASYDRNERIDLSRKYGLLCKNLSWQGFTVIIATVSMFDEVYAWNRKNLPNYFEIYLSVPLKELIRRDPKNIYKRFSTGIISNVAGLDLSVDEPKDADLIIDFAEGYTIEEIVDDIFKNWSIER